MWMDEERFRHVIDQTKGSYRATFLCERDLEPFQPPKVDIGRTRRRKAQTAGVEETPSEKKRRLADGTASSSAKLEDQEPQHSQSQVQPQKQHRQLSPPTATLKQQESQQHSPKTSRQQQQEPRRELPQPKKMPQPPQQEKPQLPVLPSTEGQPGQQLNRRPVAPSSSSSSDSDSEQEAKQEKPGTGQQPQTQQPQANMQGAALPHGHSVSSSSSSVPAAGRTQPQAQAQKDGIGQRKDQQTCQPRAQTRLEDVAKKTEQAKQRAVNANADILQAKTQRVQPRTQPQPPSSEYYSYSESELDDDVPSSLRLMSSEESDLVVVKPTAIAPHRGRTPHSAGPAVRPRRVQWSSSIFR